MPIPVLRRALTGLLAAVALAAAANAADFQDAKDAPDLTKVHAAIDAKNYPAALAELRDLEAKVQQPDVYSLMGFVLRKSGDRPQAMIYYQKALALDPEHKGALEYQGELFIELGQIDKAQENLAKLDKLCSFGCDEEEDLKAAIDQALKAKG